MKVLKFIFLLGICTFQTHFASSQTTNYTEASLGFDPGELHIIASPDAQKILPIVTSSFRGIPRFGLQNDYSFRSPPPGESPKVRMARKDLMTKIRADEDLVRHLITINTYRNTIDLESWKKLYDPTDNVTSHTTTANYTDGGIYWLSLFKTLAAFTTTSEAFEEYFCKTGESCLISGPGSSYKQSYMKSKAQWGGRGSEFEKRRKVIAFTDNLAPTYLEWSKEFDIKEAYMVGQVGIGEYDFKAGGFPLRGLQPVNTGYLIPIEFDREDPNSLFKFDYPTTTQRKSGILLKMPMDKAEAFIEDIKKKSYSGRGQQVYYAYKVTISLKEKRDTATDYGFQRPEFTYKQVPANRTIEFFSDIYLKDKVYEMVR